MARCEGHVHTDDGGLASCHKEEHPLEEKHEGWLLVAWIDTPHEHPPQNGKLAPNRELDR